ncbi:hypothetical protein [Mastigocoleus testarum]|uniref:Uncharacterized protein n=1 Tax=Mastigocoleus testarum BC008 TaxID=371196 RepID=A0A0V7ZGU9_9CYAN|nr:hypothetical protein [Mastigocoleus testarum]KST63812.1 hypothetical protein BC008_15250 [Mastigocoleus testarum BC008]
MHNDLLGLEITTQDIQKLTNLPIKHKPKIIINSIKRLFQLLMEKVKGPEGATIFFMALAGIVSSYVIFTLFIFSFISWLPFPSWLSFIGFCFFSVFGVQLFLNISSKNNAKKLRESMTYSLENLLRDVERFNSVVKAIDINDQIEAAGNDGVSIANRSKVIQTLRMTRDDLVRALKTERIIRENKDFIINQPELFASNLATLTAVDFTEEATEHGRLLNEALQIALDVQHEMKNLQSQQ